MRAEKRKDLADYPDGKHQDLIEAGKAHIHAEGRHPCRVIMQQFRCKKNRLGGIGDMRLKINAVAMLPNLSTVQIL